MGLTQPESTTPVWGLPNNTRPSFGARLVQEGRHLHFLADRAGLYGEFTPGQLRTLDATFPQFVKQMEAALVSGELNPRKARRFTSTLNGLKLEADTNGSFGYVYLTIYPAVAAQ
ncbi:TPA: type IV toxin-antitoxin system YeeU family antitoxin [Klebsiella pneumoniae]|uniref:type IV toxin-antitoxin system YeeU family antitoxin n=1 Tax=Klebsiella pneumoniae TaxID=573 RepID=UPI000C79C0ED|nr:type IV toxin-antitoxin system YeeU family antitoxin [Klebsiella pneumoniae]EIX9106411.1 type IV toxin-antitoxin system YeeU family antitoxin [Klebsiella pneumoniae]EIY1879762.1 type IV toxin-antitoxin system YeeU family antitoxin [Klebsiella pneumoniae]EKJ7635808.1 type IV toxin-antitoxin system YeeU family antitoxin [Klebsiella pneumoniae]MCQ0531702.1 type IV toxin-antitoxin system YeeU family antitoxin [Klebsiella pneumoniae]MCQ0574328.1 type IV toxin-antitoxin system YeeU family antitox